MYAQKENKKDRVALSLLSTFRSFSGWKLRRLAAVPFCLRHNHPRQNSRPQSQSCMQDCAPSEEHYSRQIYMKHLGTVITAPQPIRRPNPRNAPRGGDAPSPGCAEAADCRRRKRLMISWWVILSDVEFREETWHPLRDVSTLICHFCSVLNSVSLRKSLRSLSTRQESDEWLFTAVDRNQRRRNTDVSHFWGALHLCVH